MGLVLFYISTQVYGVLTICRYEWPAGHGLNNSLEVSVMKLRPMADNVLLKQHEAAETTVSGIILATTNKEKPAIYEVVAVGPGTKDVTMTVAVGDKVVVSKFTGNDIKLDGEDYKFVKQDDILAVVTD